MKNFLYDIDFLKQIDYHREKDTYARITLLTIDDYPKDYIEGTITGGSINIDGASAIRRSCSLNLLVTNEDLYNSESCINDKYWSYNNKFKLEIGVKNLINSKYPDILWFDQGTYIISSFNVSTGVNNVTVSIQGKDKMCRLNGEISGNIPIETDFGTIETKQPNGTSLIEKLPLRTIIFQAVKEYGGERAENIIINDLEATAYELWEYRGDNPMYLIVDADNPKIIRNINFDGSTKISSLSNISFANFGDQYRYYSFNTLDKTYNNSAKVFKMYNKNCYLAKIEYGETAGYHVTPLVYNSDLILKPGETVTALLDKIKNMLGNYEYFYDLQGRFVFQKKNTYVNEIFSPINGDLVTLTMYASPYSYQFTDYKLFTVISSPPNINNTKNDFTIWGTRKSISGVDLPIHVRYAITQKPTSYKSYDGINYSTTGSNAVDWRELIYQMSKDYYKHNTELDFLVKIQNNNSWCNRGVTGYEQYYSDLNGFWRQLYNPNPALDEIDQFYDNKGSDNNGANKYWNKKIHTEPNTLNFWIDFLDLKGEISNYNVEKIGARTKVVNENSVKSIYFKETPEILFIIPGKDTDIKIDTTVYSIIYIQENLQELFARSAQGISAIAKANDLIYQHTISTEALSITSVPIYYLEPNTRIYVEGYGDYTLDKISYSLNYNGTMNISGVKINKEFY